MTTPSEPPRVDIGDCERGNDHCHRPRSPRQEGSRNLDGVPFACHRPAGWGTNHQGWGACKLHGGNTRSGIVRASQDRLEGTARTYGVPADVDPAEALLEEVQRSAGIVRWLESRIGELDPEELVWGLAEENMEPGVTNDDGETVTDRVTQKWKAGVNPWVDLYMRERNNLRMVCRDAVAAGVSERMVSMYEQMGDTFAAMVNQILTEIGLTEEQQERAPLAVVKVLRQIAGSEHGEH